jgi:hypothetical protein
MRIWEWIIVIGLKWRCRIKTSESCDCHVPILIQISLSPTIIPSRKSSLFSPSVHFRRDLSFSFTISSDRRLSSDQPPLTHKLPLRPSRLIFLTASSHLMNPLIFSPQLSASCESLCPQTLLSWISFAFNSIWVDFLCY